MGGVAGDFSEEREQKVMSETSCWGTVGPAGLEPGVGGWSEGTLWDQSLCWKISQEAFHLTPVLASFHPL